MVADLIRLTAGTACVTVDPEHGGSLISLRVGDQELLLPPTGHMSPFPMSGSFLMAPWVGHLADGWLPFQGTMHRLPRTWGGHAVHGLVAADPWTEEDCSPTHVSLARPLGPPWPFGGTVRQEIRLSPDAIELRAAITATDGAMPAALGWHPWFLRPAGLPVRAGVRAEAILEHDAGELPTGRRLPIDGEADLTSCPDLGDRRIDIVYLGASRPCELWLGERRLSIDFDDRIETVVVYTPPDAVCLEPWSSWPDAPRLSAAGHDTGLVDLEPGDSLERWTRWSWA